ncbi:MAG: Lrp/AsnC family transcriptional regulator [Oscillibacter sp.]|nr:Lrp/AsnC family transcriptional regulator [Oscillibacter sp.]MBQ9618707.1 Lrp/AsnC family transcriptional regulator [Oscillibacter sp.]
MNPAYIPLIRLLQEEFPVCERPFTAIAAQLGTSEREILDMVETLRREGALKRIGAALYHTRAGYCFNSMVVWDVPEERLQDAADAVTPLPQVTHCYARARAPEFDYNLYTMIHETSEERLAALLSDMERRISPVKFRALNTIRELKKSGMRYFTEESE